MCHAGRKLAFLSFCVLPLIGYNAPPPPPPLSFFLIISPVLPASIPQYIRAFTEYFPLSACFCYQITLWILNSKSLQFAVISLFVLEFRLIFPQMDARVSPSGRLKYMYQRISMSLALVVLEWLLMFMLFIDASFAYLVTKFARLCGLQIPCLLCSRLDRSSSALNSLKLPVMNTVFPFT